MANPPITIGPFTNVPAPGSPIASAWAQQLTQYAVDLAASLEAQRNRSWFATRTSNATVGADTWGNATTMTIADAKAGTYLIVATAAFDQGAGSGVQVNGRILAGGGGGVEVGPQLPVSMPVGQANARGSLTQSHIYVHPVAAALTVAQQLLGTSAAININSGARLSVVYLGP